jgi:hypothetical protein
VSEGERKERKKPERAPTDPEMLAMGRCGAVMRRLGLSPKARARVAIYLLGRAREDMNEDPVVAGEEKTGTLFE